MLPLSKNKRKQNIFKGEMTSEINIIPDDDSSEILQTIIHLIESTNFPPIKLTNTVTLN